MKMKIRCGGEYRNDLSEMAMGQNPVPQNGTIGFDPQPDATNPIRLRFGAPLRHLGSASP